MKINFRKISAVAASLLMTGMTAGFAAAASYPAPFVENGTANVAIVHGTGAGVSALDSIEAGNIQTHLNTFVTDTGVTTITGDSVLLSKSSDNLNLGDAINGPFGSTVDDDDLDLLADVVYVADDSDTFDAEQRIVLGGPELAHFRDSDYENLVGLSDRTPVIGVNISNNQFVMNYTLDFLDDAESDVVSGDLDDLEGSFLPLLGKTFYVSDWDNGTVAGQTGKLTLLDSAVRGVVEGEGVVKTVTMGTTAYDVSISFADADSTSLLVNGELTSDLLEGETEKLSDGTYVGITDIQVNDYEGGVRKVEFSLGTGKLELEHKKDIQLNDDTVSDVKAYLYKASPSSGVAKINKIAIEWKADDELFITPESEIELPGLGGLKFSMTDFVRPTEDLISIQNDGDNSVELRLPIKDGIAGINLLFSNATDAMIGIGEASDKRLATSPINRLTYWEKKGNNDFHQYFVATYNDSDNGESYLLDLRTEETTTRNETDVYNVVTGTFETKDKIATDTINIGDVSFTIESIHVNSTDEYVNITAGTNTNFNTVYSTGGLRVYLPYHVGYNASAYGGGEADPTTFPTLHNIYAQQSENAIGAFNFTLASGAQTVPSAGHSNNTWHLTMDGEDKDDNIASGSAFEVRISERLASTSATELYVDQVNTTGTFQGTGGVQGEEQGNTNVYEAYVYDAVAPKILHYTDPDQKWAEVYYPTGESETYGEVYLTETGATSMPEGGVVLVKDTEVSSVASKNLVIVGGSCINSAAATLVGGALCGSSWTDSTGVGSGQFLVKAYPDSTLTSALALLVSGYEAADTQAAGTYVTTQTFDTSTVDFKGPVLGV